MMLFSISIALTLLFSCIVIAVCHSFYLGRLSLLDWAVLGIGLVYGGGWALVILATEQGLNPFWSPWLTSMSHLYSLHTIGVFLLLFSILIGWFGCTILFGRRQAPLLAHTTFYDYRLRVSLWVLLGAGVVFQSLYVSVYGGFLAVLDYSAAIRSGITQVHNPLSFLQPFGGLALFSSIGFFGLCIRHRRIGNVVGFLVSFLFSLYLLYSWLGRIGFLIYLSTFLLGLTMARNPSPMRLIIGGGGGMVLVIFAAYRISAWLGINSSPSFPAFAAKELSFPFASFFAQLHEERHLFEMFQDFIYTPLYFLPSSWWSGSFETVGQINTRLIMGAAKGEEGVTGAIPVDMLTLGLMQASFAGILMVGMMFGVLLRILQRLIDGLAHPGIRAMFQSYLAIKIAVFAVFYSEPYQFIVGNFALILAGVIIWICLRMPRITLLRSYPLSGSLGGVAEGGLRS